jgi:predicted nuclease of restriction endonuclease-like (RecB) superfamily
VALAATKRNKGYGQFISSLKAVIEKSRYQAASSVNREVVLLYLEIGKMLAQKTEREGWGAKVLEDVSSDIQKEFKGIRGFSVRNLSNMQLFYAAYKPVILQTLSAELKTAQKPRAARGSGKTPILQTLSAELKNGVFLNHFFNVGFSHHLLILAKCTKLEERVFYIVKSAENNWSYRVLEYQVASKLYKKQGKLINNFKRTLPRKIHRHAIESFKDEYLLNFININEEDNERELETAIVNNIKLFMMSLGPDFSFIGNQHRMQVGKKEFFVDLLFFNRRLQALVALDLKTTEFRPEHAGKMDFYLTALDKQVRMPHENSSIGIILCKEKDKTVVEYSLHTKQNPIGVSIFDYKDLPEKYKEVLPDPKSLIKLLSRIYEQENISQ